MPTIAQENQLPKIVDLSYQFLKEKGIAYIQELAGKVWTDYNEHDPGITMLEELCYAIVDLNYRTNFYIEDLIAPNPDDPEEDAQQFYNAEEILPCNPLTVRDFLKIVIDVPGVRNAKILLSEGPQVIKGGYRVLLDLEERTIQRRQEEEVIEEVSDRLRAQRNLCEDFFEIGLLKPLHIRLNASLAVQPGRTHDENAKLLAKVLFKVQSFFTPYIQFRSLRYMLINKDMPVEKIYTGPLLEQGFIDDQELAKNDPGATIYISEILERITSITEVKSIMKFAVNLEKDEQVVNKMVIEVPEDCILKINVDQSNITLHHNGAVVPISTEKVRQYFAEMVYAYTSQKNHLAEEEIAWPQGRFRNLSEHISIQQQFPLVYGIGHEGLPKSAPDERKAQAKQLQGYLLFFEQFFANYLAQLAHVKDMLAVQPQKSTTYFSQMPTGIPRLREIIKLPNSNSQKKDIDFEFQTQRKYLSVSTQGYRSKAKERHEEIQEAYQYYLHKIVANKVHHRTKKNKTLDHLLARFAESFVDYSMLVHGTLDEDALKDMMGDKRRFLRDYVRVSRDRNQALDLDMLQVHGWDSKHISGFERRIYRLLGINNLQRRLLHEILKDNFYVAQGTESHQNLEIFLGENIQYLHEDMFFFKGNFPKIRNIAIQEGSKANNYAIREKADGTYKIILYANQERQKHIQLINKQSTIKSVGHANAIIKQAVKFFTAFNEKSEGFHLVEHILLRNGTTFEGPNDPYSFTMTMVFPAWPARFQKASFRNLVHELILKESPAHVLVNVLWLDFEEMQTFEKTYKAWFECKATLAKDDPQLHTAANNLLGLIILYSNEET